LSRVHAMPDLSEVARQKRSQESRPEPDPPDIAPPAMQTVFQGGWSYRQGARKDTKRSALLRKWARALGWR
jgi:hypothetical protein